MDYTHLSLVQKSMALSLLLHETAEEVWGLSGDPEDFLLWCC